MTPITKVINVTTSVEFSAEEVAEVFWTMDDTQQAAFFNHLGFISGPKLDLQLSATTNCELLNSDGRRAMRTIGEYANPTD